MTKRKHRRRRLIPAQSGSQQHAGEYLSPGVWVDHEGALHFSVPELLAHLGLPNTPEAIEAATETIRLALTAEAPDAEIVVLDEGTDVH